MSDLRMPDLNKVFLAGRLTRDPDLRYTASNVALCKLGLAVSRIFRTKDGERREETLFINATAWRGTAEFCKERLHKGDPVIIEGRLKSDEWEDKSTGQRRTSIEAQVDRLQQLAWPDEGREVPKPEPSPVDEPVPEDDIPF